MPSLRDLDALSSAELKALVVARLERMAVLERTTAVQPDGIVRLKGGPGRPTIKPSRMERATQPKPPGGKGKHGWGGKKTARRVIHEDRVAKATAPAGSRFKGYEDFGVQDLMLRPHVARYRGDLPLHTNGSENDIRCQVTKPKISGGTRSDTGRNCRDAFPQPSKDLQQAAHRLLGLSRQQAGRPGLSPCSAPARPCQPSV